MNLGFFTELKAECLLGDRKAPTERKAMLKRLLCLLLVFVLFTPVAYAKKHKKTAEEKETPAAQRFDFDLAFSLDPEALPARARSRARGYAELLDCLQLRGNITLCEATRSFDISASLFFRDKPEVSIPFRFYGCPSLLFLTSPVIANETLLFNMPALAEFAIKVRKSLDTPLPALALLYPHVYEYNFYNVWKAWDKYTGPADTSRKISVKNINALADAWQDLIANDQYLNVWMTALYSVTSAPEAVEIELNGIPSYLKDFISAGKPLTVKIGSGTETWRNAAGLTLFSREDTPETQKWSLTLPADENRYATNLSFVRTNSESSFDFRLDGSILREKAALPPGYEEEEYAPVTGSDEEDVYPLTGGDEEYESESLDEEDSQWPETMLLLSVSGSSVPTSFPCTSSFSAAASVKGALYPNFDFSVLGETKKDGNVSVSLCLPQEDGTPVPFLTCSGTVVPGTAEFAPDHNYKPKELYGNYNFFSFSEYYMANFKAAVTKPLLKGLLDFVAEAPTAACQSLLDDLTDSGIISMMLMGQ